MPSLEAYKGRFAELDAEIVGISVDHIAVLKSWTISLGFITYPICSDFWPHGEVARKYGVLQPGGFSERAIFIVDQQGKIAYIDVHAGSERPDPEELLEVLRGMEA